MSTKINAKNTVIIGGQWGDEGKGRVVDSYAAHTDIVARFQGGNNAGHSLHFEGKSLVLHLLPCGIVHKDKISVIGNGVVIDPDILFHEIEELKNIGIECSPKNLKISERAHIIFPFHKALDILREETTSKAIGTTKRGIGPTYEDKIARVGIRAKDLICEKTLREKLVALFQNRRAKEGQNNIVPPAMVEEILGKVKTWSEKISPFLCDVGEFLHDALCQKKNVLFEGAQGSLLDVDHGTYPYVTSSSCVAAQASIGTGVGAKWFDQVLLVTKAYCTRVGEGPFLSEIDEGAQENFRNIGQEFGATTGRARRCGWLDLPALQYAARINGASGLVLTKVDILAQMGSFKIVTKYFDEKNNPLSFNQALSLVESNKKIKKEFISFDCAEKVPDHIAKISDFPAPIQEMIDYIQEHLGLPIKMICYGKERGKEFFL